MDKLTDKEFREKLGFYGSRKALKNWKRKYYRVKRKESPQQFFFRIMGYWDVLTKTDGWVAAQLSFKAGSLKEGQRQ